MTVMSSAVLVLQTRNSVYTVEVRGFETRLTCQEGTLKGQVTRQSVIDMDDHILEQWQVATGKADPDKGPQLRTASKMAASYFTGKELSFRTTGQDGKGKHKVELTRVQYARWCGAYTGPRRTIPVQSSVRVVDWRNR